MHALTDLPDEDLELGIRDLVRKSEGGEHTNATSTSLAYRNGNAASETDDKATTMYLFASAGHCDDRSAEKGAREYSMPR